MHDIKPIVDEIMALGFRWDGKDYIHPNFKYDGIRISQQELFDKSDEDCKILITLIKDKMKKKE
jgi:hypothetical protein